MEIRALHYATGLPTLIRLNGGVIEAIEASEGGEGWPLVGPGLVDLQINGFGGHDVNAAKADAGMLGKMIQAMWAEGVTTCFPTVITNSSAALSASMAMIARACDSDEVVWRGVGGIHLEGPFISVQDGARGAHCLEFVRGPDWGLFEEWQEASGGRIRIITLSPEWAGSEEFIRRCVASGVTVSIGHTSASPEQIAGAVRAGARLSTHLGNAAHLMLPRHPNYLWEQLAQDDLWCTLIADGFHLPDQVLKVAMKVKGERAMLISDAVSLAGMPAGEYTMPVGGRVVLTEAGRLYLAENDKLLAGSAQMLLRGVEHLVGAGLASLSEAWEMGSVRPGGFMGLACGLEVGGVGDFVLFREEGGRFVVEGTYKEGEVVYRKE